MPPAMRGRLVGRDDESPQDRELRRLGSLSAEVGAACTAWLASRGIRTKPWGSFNRNHPGANHPRPDPVAREKP